MVGYANVKEEDVLLIKLCADHLEILAFVGHLCRVVCEKELVPFYFHGMGFPKVLQADNSVCIIEIFDYYWSGVFAIVCWSTNMVSSFCHTFIV